MLTSLLALYCLLNKLAYSQEFRISNCTSDGKFEFIYQDLRANFTDAVLGCSEEFGSTLASLSNEILRNFSIEFLDSIREEVNVREYWLGLGRPLDDDLIVQGILNLEDPTIFTFEDGSSILPGEFGSMKGADPWNINRPNNADDGNEICVLYYFLFYSFV